MAAHAGSVALLLVFAILADAAAGQLTLRRDRAHGGAALPSWAGCCVLGLVGFGVKAGVIPLHVWLPEAHAAAPSHVSALMSGAMVKLGLYGLLRLAVLLGPLPAERGPRARGRSASPARCSASRSRSSNATSSARSPTRASRTSG